MKKNHLIAVLGTTAFAALLAGAAAFGWWRYDKYRHAPPPPQGLLLLDRSDSILGGCDDVSAMAREMLASSRFEPGSSIGLMVTGDDSTAGEPVLLGTFEVPVTRRVVEGRAKGVQQQRDLIDRVKSRCEESPQTKRSPIYMAVRRASEYLRSRGCKSGSSCWLYLKSDLEELSEGRIRDLIEGAPGRVRKASDNTSQLPTLIDNAGINVSVCGLSETAGAPVSGGGRRTILTPIRDARRADRIRSVWEQLFSDPPRVSFSPSCPKG